MLDKKVIDRLVFEILNMDQALFNKEFEGEKYVTNKLPEWYRKTGAEHALVAVECYNAAWNIEGMLEGFDIEKVQELSNNVGLMGLAHHKVAKQYKTTWLELIDYKD